MHEKHAVQDYHSLISLFSDWLFLLYIKLRSKFCDLFVHGITTLHSCCTCLLAARKSNCSAASDNGDQSNSLFTCHCSWSGAFHFIRKDRKTQSRWYHGLFIFLKSCLSVLFILLHYWLFSSVSHTIWNDKKRENTSFSPSCVRELDSQISQDLVWRGSWTGWLPEIPSSLGFSALLCVAWNAALGLQAGGMEGALGRCRWWGQLFWGRSCHLGYVRGLCWKFTWLSAFPGSLYAVNAAGKNELSYQWSSAMGYLM